MSKIIFLMVFTVAIINLKAQIALPVAATGNVLKDGTTANNAAVASTSTAGFKLAVNGAVLYYGTGVNTVTSPTIYLRNLTASTGRIYALNSDNTGLFTISDATGTTSPLTHINRFVINSTGNVGIGVTAPTSLLHLNAGSAAAGTAPLKFTSGTPTTTPEIGALNFTNGLLMLDSSNTKRDTLATRGWARTNLSFTTDSTKFQTKFRSDSARTNTYTILAGKQSTLVSGTSIKTINSTSLLGSGDIALEPIITAPNSIKNYLNGYKKFVSFNTDSITEGTTNQFYTNARSRSAISITTTGINGAATYNSSTGVLNIPVYAATGGTVTSVGLTSTDITIGGLSPITSSGTYSLSLPTVNANVGTFNNITLNAKGQATAGSNIAYLVPTDTANIRSRLVAGNNITISGTYPNQTIASVASGGTVTNVAPITIGTTGTDLSSTVVSGTTTPVITLNVPTASASNRGALSSTDWTSFNSKQNTLSGTTNRITILSNVADISSSYIGQTSISTLGTISAGIWNGTTIGANYGGTGQSTVTTGDILYGSATNTWSKLGSGSNGQVLTVTSGIPSWSTPAINSGWGLSGNTGTASTTNFIGTTDNKSLSFRTNNTEKFRIDSIGNIGIGTSNPLYKLDVNGTARFTGDLLVKGLTVGLGSGAVASNMILGYQAGQVNTTGGDNNFIGYQAAYSNTTGGFNFILGSQAGFNNTIGNYNNFISYRAGYSNISGNANNFIGYTAGFSNTTGSYNNFIGSNSGFNNTIGDGNIFISRYTGLSNTSGSYNSVVGYAAGYNNTTGSYNSILGYQAGRFIADGTTSATIINNSVLIGTGSRPLADNQTNQVAIGFNAIGDGSNTTVLGNTSITSTKLFGQLKLPSYGVGTKVGTPTYALQVDATGNIIEASLSGGNSISLTSLSAITPINYNNVTGVFSISQSTSSSNGYLNSTDWTTFNNKQSLISLTTNGSGIATLIGNTLNIPTPSLTDLNFAANDLRFTGDRNHSAAQKNMTIDSIKTLSFLSDTLILKPSNQTYSMRNNLYYTPSNTLASGNLVEWSNNSIYTDGVTLADVGIGTSNPVYITRYGSSLAVERRPHIIASDTIFYSLTTSFNLANSNMYMVFYSATTKPIPATALLHDNFLGTTTPLSTIGGDTTKIFFTVTSDPATRTNRFYLVFTPLTPWTVLNVPLDSVRGNTTPTQMVVLGSNNSLKRFPISLLTAGNGWGLTGNVGTNITSNFIGTTDNSGLTFRTNNTSRLLINAAGNVGIGTVNISDTTYKLFVEKGIRTRKLKVDAASIVWADYVFDKDYKLPALQEVDKFIQQNKHLPGVQSTAEISKNGIGKSVV